MEKHRILIVDDDQAMLDSFARIFQKKYDCVTCSDPLRALERLKDEPFDLMITDLKMRGMDGIELLGRSKEVVPDLIVIIVTGYGSIENAVQAMKLGAFHYVTKPFQYEEIQLVIKRALTHQELTHENRMLKEQIREKYAFENIVSSSLAMKKIFDILLKVANTEANILIHGESGTGKELIARSIHVNSRRHGKPFIPVDCGAMVDTLMESELFGHEKGAFTGAHQMKAGLLSLADGGTIFFDEVGELSPTMQAKLLRTIQERQFRRVGGNQFISVDIRIIAATNKDLKQAAAEKTFREDLMHRLNVITIDVPPLRERIGDIPVLACHFLKNICQKSNIAEKKFSKECLVSLEHYRWPGNVRELQNIVERSIVLSEGQLIEVDDLPDHLRPVMELASMSLQPGPFKRSKREWIALFEKKYLQDILKLHEFNVSKAADYAGIDRKSIQRMMKRYNITTE